MPITVLSGFRFPAALYYDWYMTKGIVMNPSTEARSANIAGGTDIPEAQTHVSEGEVEPAVDHVLSAQNISPVLLYDIMRQSQTLRPFFEPPNEVVMPVYYPQAVWIAKRPKQDAAPAGSDHATGVPSEDGADDEERHIFIPVAVNVYEKASRKMLGQLVVKPQLGSKRFKKLRKFIRDEMGLPLKKGETQVHWYNQFFWSSDISVYDPRY